MLRFTAIIAAAALPTAAHASADASRGALISAEVPELCQIDASGLVIDAATGDASGSVFEMCNSGRGFRVMASHRALGPGEEVQVNYAGEVRELDPTGISPLAHRNGPTVGNVPVIVRSSGLVGTLAISIGVMAI